MNKQIRAIWETNDSITVVWPETGSPVRVSAALLEKFAELLIKDCIEAIQNESMNSDDDWERGLRIAEGAIEKHFGVEE